MRVLIVDDQPVSLAAVRQTLEMQGHEVVGMCTDGAAALAAASSVLPEVVLVDQKLGTERGTDVVRALRDANPDLPVVLMSLDYPPPLEEVRASGAASFVLKDALLDVDLESLIE